MDGMSISKCFVAALQSGYKYFGLQNGNECWAGSDYAAAIRNGWSFNCNNRCSGNPDEVCGNAGRNSMYRIGTPSAPEYGDPGKLPTCILCSCIPAIAAPLTKKRCLRMLQAMLWLQRGHVDPFGPAR